MTALEDITHPKVQLPRPPANPEELWWVVRTLWGVTIPRTAVCGDHVAPFTAFAEGYFGNDSNIVLWYGSRGCLAADTLITVNRAGLGRKRPIGAFVRRLHGTYRHLGLKGYSGGKPYDPAIPTYVQRAEGDVARLGLLGNAWDSGVKQTYELVTDSGRRIRATAEHPFLLASGDYVPLGDLATGDEVRVNIGRSTRGRKVKQRYDRTTARFHPHSSRGQYWTHRLVVEAHLNKMGFDDYMQRVNDPVMATSLSILPRNVHVHHRNHDHLDNRLDNLELVDPSTHHREHAYAGKMNHVLEQIGSERVTSIAKWHEPEPTYDLTLADDPHNYIANGFVVHNTGKSLLLALLALTKAAILEINVTLLGGSMAQSNNVQEHIESLLTYPGAPSWAVAQQIQTQITFSGGNWIRPLPASQKTVRGPHPQMTCLADWTMVASPDGDRTIGQLEAGQRVYVSDDLVTPREGVVLGVIDQGWKITVDVIADRARLACTSDHRIHTQRGWVEAGQLVPGDVLTMWQSPGAVVQRVDQRGPYVHVWDITTDAGNFYADGVLVHNCLDEIDEMDRKVYDAAMGQAMSRPNARGIIIPEMVVASSTWQNPVGTFQEVRDEFLAKGLPVRTWCLDGEALIETAVGYVPLKDVTPGTSVMTREGWFPVQHVTNVGVRPTVVITTRSGLVLRLTPDHKVATVDGWVEAGSLLPGALVFTSARATHSMTTVGPDPDVAGVGHVMATPTGAGALTVGPRSAHILAGGDNLHVSGVDAQGVAAQMVNVKAVGDGSVDVLPDPAVSVHARMPSGGGVVGGLDSVISANGVSPWDALVSRDQVIAEANADALASSFVVDHVVSVNASQCLTVYDMGVHGPHEFVANGIVVHNCFREVLRTEGNPDGWMDPEFIERKRKAVPAEMFRVEYDLGEPAGGSRAFDLERLNAAFVPMVPVSERHAGSDDEWVFEAPVSTGWYAVGADWAKESDRTVIVVARIDESVRRVVYVRCVNRRPWPEMAGMFNDVLRRYANVVAAHDGTGIGNVVNDLIDERALKFIMSGRKRSDMLVDYISAVEQGRYRLPVGCTLLSAHKATTVEDVYAPGKWNGHLPDEVAACALAHYAAEHGAPVAAMVGVERSEYRPRATKELYPEGSVTVVGDVRNVTGVDDGGWNFLV